MIRLIWSGVRFARGRAVALAAGMLVAATAFSLLTASVDVGTARIKGIVGRNWRGAYDLLVLPAGSGKAPGTGRLVQDNYLSTASGGITAAQYRRIAHLPGVGVAAPLAILGYVLETAFIGVDVSSVAGRTGARVLTVTSRFTADHGLSKYPPRQEGYVYITPDPLTPLQLGRQIGPVERLPDGRNVTVCPIAAGQAAVGQSSPFQLDAGLLSGSCYSRTSQAPATVQGTVAWSFPVLVAAIDPQAENQLTGLGRAVTSGRYLGQGEGDTGTDGTTVPVLASTVSFDGDDDQVTVSLLPPSAVGVVRSDLGPAHIAGALGTEKASPVMRLTITGAQAWQQLLNQLAAPAVTAPGTHAVGVSLSRTLGQYWTSGQVADHREIGGQRDPVPVANPDSVWLAGIGVNGRDYVFAPPAAADTGFRTLTEHIELSGQGTGETVLQTVGQFDPNRLAGFSGGPGSPLASYRAPLLTGANAASRALLGGRPLEPSGNMAGYAQPPPLLLTTLAGLRTLENPERYSGTSGQATAPIGSIRVRVAGLHGTVRQQLAKIAAVGQEISKATGLRVDVTAGSSQQQVAVGLAAGKFGRPMLQLSEPWTATSVSLVILRQADRESLALFVLILAVCGLFLAAATLAGVRGRRAEIGTLRALGWGRRQVFALVLGEVVVLGVLAGLAGAVLSAALIAWLGLALPLWRAALVLPVAAALAVVAGLVPAWLATRAEPTGALARAVRGPRRKGRRVRSVAGLAITGVARVPGRCALAGAGLAVGVGGLAILLAAQASFAQSIGDSALAGLVTASTRGTDLVSALLTVGLGAAAVADVTYLNLRERAAELAALAASGWGRAQLGQLLATEAVLTSVAGALAGAAAGLATAAAAFGLSLPVVAGAVAAAAGGVIVSLAGTATVLILASGRPLAAALAADE